MTGRVPVAGLVGENCSRRDVVLRTDLAVDDRPVTGDRVQLQQVL